jgi:hypothetical protein
MPNPERPHHYPILIPGGGVRLQAERLPRPTARALASVEHRTIVRVATNQAEALVATEQAREIDHTARDMMSGQSLLAKWRDTLSAGDLFLNDELKFFSDTARLGKGEILANLIDTYCRESRG